MLIVYVWMQTRKTISLIVKSSDTILSVKNKIHEIEGILPDSHQLMYHGKELVDRCTLSLVYPLIEEGSTIYSAPITTKGNDNYSDIVLQMLHESKFFAEKVAKINSNL